MRKLRNRLLCLVIAFGAVFMTEQVGAENPYQVCCDLATAACTNNGPGDCWRGPCPGNAICGPDQPCSGIYGGCYRSGYGCQLVSVSCFDVLGCTSCQYSAEPDDSGDEVVEAESDDPGEESVEEECDDEAPAHSTLSLTALLIFLAMALPAAPMIIRRWAVRK